MSWDRGARPIVSPIPQSTRGKLQSILLLHFRNFGDAVIGLGLVHALQDSQPDISIDILTRPQFTFLFENQPRVRAVYTAQFPIGTLNGFKFRSMFALIRQIVRARLRRYDAVANLFGDVRENFAGWLICPAGNCAPIWPQGHAVQRQSRIGPRWLLSHPLPIDDTKTNIYSAMNALANLLGAKTPAVPVLFGANRHPILPAPVAGRVGFHVSAGQECRRWPLENWRALATHFLDRGSEVRIYCAPEEREEFTIAFEQLPRNRNSLQIFASTLDRFLEDLATCSLFVGHDSFGIHAAAAIGVPRVMINGANVSETWAPPGTRVVHGDETLPCFPCFNKPVCTATAEPFACIRRIAVGHVLKIAAAPSL